MLGFDLFMTPLRQFPRTLTPVIWCLDVHNCPSVCISSHPPDLFTTPQHVFPCPLTPWGLFYCSPRSAACIINHPPWSLSARNLWPVSAVKKYTYCCLTVGHSPHVVWRWHDVIIPSRHTPGPESIHGVTWCDVGVMSSRHTLFLAPLHQYKTVQLLRQSAA